MKKFTAVILSVIMMFSAVTAVNAADSEEYEKMFVFADWLHGLFNQDEITAQKFVGEVSEETFDENAEYGLADTAVLTKKPGEDFVIMNIADIHMSDYTFLNVFLTLFSRHTVKKLVRTHKPDLITVSGDIICKDCDIFAIRLFTDFMTELKTPWAPVFGNHDDEGNVDKNYAFEIMQKSPYCIGKKGDAEMGVGNYIVNICEEKDGGLIPVHSLIMMDSGHGEISEKQIAWYKWAAEGVSALAGKPVESSVIFHVPLAEYQTAYDELYNTKTKKWDEAAQASGSLHETICPQGENEFFKTVCETGTTKNILCSHDHMNNFSVMYKNVRLTYMLKVGKAAGYQIGFNGMTKMTVSDDGKMDVKHVFGFQLF